MYKFPDARGECCGYYFRFLFLTCRTKGSHRHSVREILLSPTAEIDLSPHGIRKKCGLCIVFCHRGLFIGP